MLISDDYKTLLKNYHADRNEIINKEQKIILERTLLGKRYRSVLDYGCGKGFMIEYLSQILHYGVSLEGYDPGVDLFSSPPSKPYEFVYSIDVLEHIEPEKLKLNLQFLNHLYTKELYLLISGYPAKKTLTDGRNCHLIIEKKEWWEKQIRENIAFKEIKCNVIKTKFGPEFRFNLVKD